MAGKAKRPRPVKPRTLPSDAISLIAMIRKLHSELIAKGSHLKREWHDFHARRGFQVLHDLRTKAWFALHAIAPQQALAIAAEMNAKLPSSVGVSAAESQVAS